MKTLAPISQTTLYKCIAKETDLKLKDVRAVFGELQSIAYAEVVNTGKFVIPELNLVLKVKDKPAKKAGVKIMFGKEVKVKAKPGKKVVKAYPLPSVHMWVRAEAEWQVEMVDRGVKLVKGQKACTEKKHST